MSNFGLLILAVGAAWTMTQLTPAADMVALVQTSLMLPVLLFSIAAGALADMYDRRKIGIAALSISLGAATMLTAITICGRLTPWVLLAFCFLIGIGMALFSPAWQASVSEQVPAETLAHAVALNSVSYNIARSFGPAIGGIIVAAAGAAAAFAVNALLYVPLLVVLLLWRRVNVSSRLPPERLKRAITSGIRYVTHSPSIRVVLWRALALAFAGSSISSLMPLIARNLLTGDARTYGFILGAFGVGAIAGALSIARIRKRIDGELAVALSAIVIGASIASVVASASIWLTSIALSMAGAGWMVSITLLNISVQLSVPRWVAGRTLAAFQGSICGGLAIGSWVWGHIAAVYGVRVALLTSATVMAITPLLARWLRMPDVQDLNMEPVDLGNLEAALALTGRSGPIVLEIEYRVVVADAREFYRKMQQVQQIRHRNGAYDWSIARNIADPELWTERFLFPTWLDYLRNRSRHTRAELDIQHQAEEFHCGERPISIRRMLERPVGSVRWAADTPDPASGQILPVANPMGGA